MALHVSCFFKNSFISVMRFLRHSWDTQFCFTLLSGPVHQLCQTAWPMFHCSCGCNLRFQITQCGLCLLLVTKLILQFISLKWGSLSNEGRVISQTNSYYFKDKLHRLFKTHR